MATFTSDTSGNWNVAATWGKGSLSGAGSPVAGTHYPQNSDEAHIDSGHTVTLVADVSVGNVVIDGGTIAGGGHKITCVKTSGRLFDHSGTITGDLDVELQGTHATTEDFVPSGSGNVNNLIINGSGLAVTINTDTTIDGVLTVTQGTLTTDGTHSHALTATGGCEVGGSGVLTLNASTVVFGYLGFAGTVNAPTAAGSLTITGEASSGTYNTYAFKHAGTFNNNDGTVTITTDANTLLDFLGASGSLHSLTVDSSGSQRSYEFVGDVTLEGNLTVATDVILQGYNNTYDLTVTGDISVTGSLHRSDREAETFVTGDTTCKSLTIENGGNFYAGSGALTITGRSSGGIAFDNDNGGKFYHGWGTVNINYETDSSTAYIKNHDTVADNTREAATNLVPKVGKSPFYNVTLTPTDGAVQFSASGSSTENIGVTHILGNLHIKGTRSNGLQTGAAPTLVVHGSLIVDSGAFFDLSGYRDGSNRRRCHMFGGITNRGTLSADSKSYPTVYIIGQGGNLEGDLSRLTDVKVRQEPILEFSGDDLVSCGNIGTHTQWTVAMWVKKTGTAENNVWDGNDASSSSFPYVTMTDSKIYMYYDNGSGGASNTDTDIPNGGAYIAWNHLAITFDNTTTDNTKVYWNGELIDTDDTNDGSAPTTFTDFTIGDGPNYENFDGQIADVKTYNDDLTQPEVAALASQINVHPSIVQDKISNLTGWWPLNEGTGTTMYDYCNTVDGCSNTAHNGTLTNGGWNYKQDIINGEVNIMDNTTTVSNLCIERGRINTRGLVSPNFDGNADYITVSDAATLDPVAGYLTIAAWIYPDNVSAGARGIVCKRAATEQTGAWHFGQNGDELNFRIYASDGASNTVTTTTSPLVAATWNHVAVTMDDVAEDVFFYCNGKLVGSDLSTITTPFTNNSHPLLIGYSGQGSEYFDGRIRDVRFYDFVMTMPQINALSAGRQGPTPQHWWKIQGDKGTNATSTIEDYGSATDSDGTGVSLAWNDGTLIVKNGNIMVKGQGAVN